MATVWIPSLLRPLADGEETVSIAGGNLRQVLAALTTRFPRLRDRLLRDDGQLQDGLAVAVDGQVAILDLLEPVRDDSEVHIIPAIGGGAA